jgi:hypothetical protein
MLKDSSRENNNQRRKQVTGLLDSILGAVTGKPDDSGGSHSGCQSLNSVRVVTLACVTRASAHSPAQSVGGLRSIYSHLADAPGVGTAFPVPLAGAGFTPAGVGDGDLFGLNKRGNLILNLRGVGDATGVGVGLGDISAVVFLRIRLGIGEAAGDSAAEGDAPLSTGGVASVLCSVRCFGGEGDSMGVPVSSWD